MSSLEEIVSKILTFSVCVDDCTATCGFSVSQMYQFCLLAKPSKVKYTSSENQMLPMSIALAFSCCIILFVNVSHSLVTAKLRVDRLNPVRKMWRLWRMIRCVGICGSPIWAATPWTNDFLNDFTIRFCNYHTRACNVSSTIFINVPSPFTFSKQRLYFILFLSFYEIKLPLKTALCFFNNTVV